MDRNRRKYLLNRDEQSSELIIRLLNCVQAATFEMETLCKLAGIKATRDIPTAAVEVGHRSRLLINPDFVDKYCQRDEHLFLLVMHELWHILLAHTQLYPRVTPAHNIAFDAIINAGLMRQFNRPEYRGFFESINPADQFPGCLLRPPEGWPYNPQYPPDEPKGLTDIMRRLYPPMPFGRWSAPLYEDILNLLRQWFKEKLAKGEVVVMPTLLGDHGDDPADNAALGDEFMGEVIRRVTEKWPSAPFTMNGRGGGESVNEWTTGIGSPAEEARRAFSSVLQKALIPRKGGLTKRTRALTPAITGMGPLPNIFDRQAPAREKLGVQGLLWVQQGMIKTRTPDENSHAYIYLDVSGSMNSLLPYLIGMLVPYVKKRDAVVFQFSTKVEPVSLEQLKAGKIRTTQGTDIACVMKHLLEANPPVKRALILTDGYTGVPHPQAVAQLKDRRIAVHVVLPAGNSSPNDLQNIARTMSRLPPHQPKAGWRPY